MDVHVHVGCIVFLCLVVRLILLASFFLPSHLSLKHVSVWLGDVYTHVLMRDERRKKERSKQGQTDKHVHVYVCPHILCLQTMFNCVGSDESIGV